MVNFHVLNNSIVVNFNGTTHNIHKEDSRYEPVLQAIRDNKLDSIPDLVDTKKQFSEYGLEIVDGLVHLDKQQLPIELSNRVLEFVKQKLPKEPLLNFWRNLRQNPSFNSRQMLYKFLEHNGHPLTQDGCFIAYRGITEDFKDCHTKSMDNSIGKVVSMDRNLVDDNPNNTCSHGLHVAAFNYAKDFGQKLVEVKVNPIDVVAVPTDYNGTKMRVCKFEVIRECEAILETEVYEHDQLELDINDTIVCPDCATEVDSNCLWCPKCGLDLETE